MRTNSSSQNVSSRHKALLFQGKRHKSWQHSPKPVEAFPAIYLGPSIPHHHPVDFLYATDEHNMFPNESSEAHAGDPYGNYSLRLSSHPQAWDPQPYNDHVGHVTTGNFSDHQMHPSFQEDNPLPAYFSDTYPQWVYPAQVQQYAPADNQVIDHNSMYHHHGHEYPSMIPASIDYSPYHSEYVTQETFEPPEQYPRDFSESVTTLLFMACDAEQLSEYQCLIRKQIELFSATYVDIQMTVQGRNRKIDAGQVGVRCRHCADIPIKKRARGAVYYPSKLSCIYQGIWLEWFPCYRLACLLYSLCLLFFCHDVKQPHKTWLRFIW